MNKLKVLVSQLPFPEILFEIKFDCDELVEFKYVKEIERSIKNPESLEIVCKRYVRQLSKYKNGKPEFLVQASYSLKFLGDEEDLKNIMKVFQKIFPDYFIGLEKESGAGGI